VVADINAGCGSCADCRQGNSHHCRERTVLGILGRDGALAEYVCVPERCLVRVPDDVSDERAVFAEPLAAALHVLDELDSSVRRVAVLGDGKLGLLIAMSVQSAGLSVTLFGHHESKLAWARGAGVATRQSDSEGLGHEQFDCVVEATGSSTGLEDALKLVRPRGTLVLKTTTANPSPVNLAPMVINEIRVVGSRCGDLSRAIEALRRGQVDPTKLIEARYPLARADEALAHARTKGVLKVLVEATPRRGA
jgi:2-desacetyl-2-hydroxyethyl bacteriochlorophyllide A dehydrogenase